MVDKWIIDKAAAENGLPCAVRGDCQTIPNGIHEADFGDEDTINSSNATIGLVEQTLGTPTFVLPSLSSSAAPARKLIVYVAGPLHSSGNCLQNMRRAMDMGTLLRSAGFTPFVPHLFAFWALMEEGPGTSEQSWLEYDLEWLTHCDALIRLPGKSYGADCEEHAAIDRGLFIASSFAQLLDWRQRILLGDSNGVVRAVVNGAP